MQNVFITNFNLLYEILDEIKENLSFKIIKIENEEDFEKKLDLDRLDHLVISKTDHKLLLNSNITDKNFFNNLNEINLKENSLQNKIYLKNLLNKAIKSYAG